MKNNTEAQIRLFGRVSNTGSNHYDFSLIDRGIIMVPGAGGDPAVVESIRNCIGASHKQMNNTFYKSFEKVKNLSLKQRLCDQLLHYFSTYGLESIGINGVVYIPEDEINIPKLKEGFEFKVITPMSLDEEVELITKLMESDIAFDTQTLEDIITVYTTIDKVKHIRLPAVKNFELKCRLYDYYKVVPDDPDLFLRYLVYKTTGETLLIKSKELIEKIKYSSVSNLNDYLNKAPHDLASIFHRYKPIFLAFKKISSNKTFFNQLRKKADKMHQPIYPDFLSSVTKMISNGDDISYTELKEHLSNKSIYRKIRLANSLAYRMSDPESIAYRIRNGKTYVDDFILDKSKKYQYGRCLSTTVVSIAKQLESKFRGKTVYIPEGVTYGLPSSQKMMTSTCPYGTSFIFKHGMVVGIHWDKTNTDLDLSAISNDGNKVGWNGSYNLKDLGVTYSGDMTRPIPEHGATEALEFEDGYEASNWTIYVNNYNVTGPTDVTFYVAKKLSKVYSKRGAGNTIVDPNDIVFSTKMTLDKRSTILGSVDVTSKWCKLNIAQSTLSNSNVSRSNHNTNRLLNYYNTYFSNVITLNEIINLARGKIVHDNTNEVDIDLSPTNVNKSTFINLLTVD